jgi:hypothetical protein
VESIEVGAEVVTADGQALGRVKHTSPSAFQVDAPRQQDYWLETTIVKNSSSLRVELLIEQSQIGAYKMDRPHDLSAFHEAGVDPQVLNRKANPRAQ